MILYLPNNAGVILVRCILHIPSMPSTLTKRLVRYPFYVLASPLTSSIYGHFYFSQRTSLQPFLPFSLSNILNYLPHSRWIIVIIMVLSHAPCVPPSKLHRGPSLRSSHSLIQTARETILHTGSEVGAGGSEVVPARNVPLNSYLNDVTSCLSNEVREWTTFGDRTV